MSSIPLEAVDIVKNFSIFTNALKIQKFPSKGDVVVKIPGSSSVTIVSHIISVDATGSKPPILSIEKSAFSGLKGRVSCGEFYGGFL
jgi:hypothetical protein